MAWPGFQGRRIPALALAVLAVLAWCALWAGESSPWAHTLFHSGHALSMDLPPATLAALFVFGWTIMTIAMMLPASAPLVMLFDRLVAGRAHAGWLVAMLIAGYLAVWASFGLAAHLLMRVLHAAWAQVPWLLRRPWLASAAILLCAGVYQLSPLKYACLDKCRSPLSFLIERWRGAHPAREAFRLGADHGAWCVGCCWPLMALMFVAGMGSLAAMFLLALAMGAEKNFGWGRRLRPVLGGLLVAGAAAVLLWQSVGPG
jgi:predicted metal-binding membrane protein